MGRYKQLGKNTLLVFLGNMGSKLIAFVMVPFYTQWLSVEDYGTSDNILTYGTLFLSVVTLSISESIFIFPKDQKIEKQKQFFSSSIAYSSFFLVLSGLLLIAIKELLISSGRLHSISSNIGFLYLIMVASFFQNFLQQFCRSINKIAVYALSGLVFTFSTAGLSFFLIPRFGLNGLFGAQVLALFLSCSYALFHSRSYRFFSIQAVSLKKYREMARYSVPLIPNAVMWWLVGSLNRPMLEEYSGMHAIGLFAVANKLPSLINVTFSIFMVSWQTAVIDEYGKQGYNKFYNKIFRLVFGCLSLTVIFLAIFAKPLTALVADAKFQEASRYIPVLSLAALFSAVSAFAGTNFSATRESRYYFYSSVWGAVVAIVLNVMLIPIWGLYGAIVSLVLSHLIMAISRIWYSWPIVQVSNVLYYLVMLIICLTVVLAVAFVDDQRMVSITVIVGICLMMWAMKGALILGFHYLLVKCRQINPFSWR